MAYKRIGAIESIFDIPMNKNLIVTGHVNKNDWMWCMGGMFKKKGDEIIFINEHGMVTKVVDGEIGLTILMMI